MYVGVGARVHAVARVTHEISAACACAHTRVLLMRVIIDCACVGARVRGVYAYVRAGAHAGVPLEAERERSTLSNMHAPSGNTCKSS